MRHKYICIINKYRTFIVWQLLVNLSFDVFGIIKNGAHSCYCSWISGLIAWALRIFGIWRLNDLPLLVHGVFLLLYVFIMFPQWVSHSLKVETTTTILFNFSLRVLTSYIDVWVEFSLVLLIVYEF